MTHQQQCEAFWAARRSLILSTVNSKGELETSVAPFITDDQGHLYIFISEQAQHTQNILYLLDSDSEKASPCISGLLLSDEPELDALFARERLTLQLRPSEISRTSELFSVILLRFEESFGEIVTILAKLPDFHLFQLTVTQGKYVKGFGQAFTFKGCPCQHLTPVQRRVIKEADNA